MSAAVEDIEGEESVFKGQPVDSGNALVRGFRALIVNLTVWFLGVVYWGLFFMGQYGYGDVVFLTLESYGSFFTVLAIGSVSLVFLLALLDIGYWRGCFWYIGQILIAITMTGFMLTALTFTSQFPAASVCVYLVTCPILLYLLKVTFLRGMTGETFLFWISIGLFVDAVVAFVVWIIWVVNGPSETYPVSNGVGNYWDIPLISDFYIRLNCTLPYDITSRLNNQTALIAFIDSIDYAGLCDEAFFMWITPLILSVFCLILSIALLFLYRAQMSYYQNKKRMDAKTQMFFLFIALVLLGMWSSASIAGAQIGLATLVFTFSFLFLVVGTTAIVLVTGIEGFKRDLISVPLAKRIIESSGSDWLRALGVIALFPASFVIFPLSFLRQLGRRCLPFTKPVDEAESKLVFTLEVSKFLARARRWHWTSVLTKMIYWGILFFCVSVMAARVLNVFFSYLNSVFVANRYSFVAVVFLYLAAAAFVFQFPPTPGMPIYYAAGVIIPQVAISDQIISSSNANNANLWFGWAIAVAVSLAAKYSLVISGQLIGYFWANSSVTIRRLVGVNSPELRSIKYILMQKGLTFPKVSVLLGGPDWPVAVICGILHTSLPRNLLGNFPIILMIIPATLAGTLLLVANENAQFASAAAIALSLTVLTQGISMIAALHYIEATSQDKKQDIDQFPIDEEVARLDEASAVKLKKRRYASQWYFLPLYMKFIMLTGAIAETISLYLFLLFGSRCFVNFSVNDSIDTVLNGNALNLVLPLGWFGIGLFIYGVVVVFMLGRWISYNVNKVLGSELITATSENQSEEDDELTSLYSGRYSRCCGACC